MAKRQIDDDRQWWPRIKDWLGILLVIVPLALVGWISVLEGIHRDRQAREAGGV